MSSAPRSRDDFEQKEAATARRVAAAAGEPRVRRIVYLGGFHPRKSEPVHAYAIAGGKIAGRWTPGARSLAKLANMFSRRRLCGPRFGSSAAIPMSIVLAAVTSDECGLGARVTP
ncbi:hypothetical protein GCM10009813_27920 [Brevibacterium marinum]